MAFNLGRFRFGFWRKKRIPQIGAAQVPKPGMPKYPKAATRQMPEQRLMPQPGRAPILPKIPEIAGEYRNAFLRIRPTSTHFVGICSKNKLDPGGAFAKLFNSFEGALDSPWVKAREDFEIRRKEIRQQQNLGEQQKMAAERRALERIFARMLEESASKKK